jgi:hypothetical protein
MRRTLIRIFLAAAMGAGAAGAAVADDRAPTPSERAAIEAFLRAQGYTRWEEIELDDGKWEVDDAIAADGKEYDLKLSVNPLAIIKRDD